MSAEPRIEARLTTFDTAMVVFSLVVGIGIFRTPALVAHAAGDTTLFYVAWIGAGLVSLAGALTFAEIGARHPRAGGYYRVVADCYHPAFAFMLNWAQALMQGASNAGVAFIGADYLAPVILPASVQGPAATQALAIATMLVLLAINYRGIRSGARTQNWLSLAKIALMAGLALAALALAPHHPVAAPAPATPWPWRLASAVIPCFYAYGGYQMTMNLGADLKDAPRRFPVAITAGVLAVIALYFILNLAYQLVLGTGGLAGASLVAADLARATFGEAGATFVSVAVFVSAAGFVNANILQMPRSFYAMAEDGALPRAFLRVNPRTQAQEFGLVFFGVTLIVPAFLLGSFEKLLNYVMFTDALTLATVASTLFVLRHRRQGEGGYAMRGYPWLPLLYFVCLVGVALRVLVTEPALAATGAAIFLAGWPLYRIAQRALAD